MRPNPAAPWFAPFQISQLTDDQLMSRVHKGAVFLDGLDQPDAEASATQLEHALAEIHVSSRQDIANIRMMCGLGLAHATRYYASVPEYCQRRHLKEPFEVIPPVKAFSGEPGIGKTDVNDSVRRLISIGSSIEVGGEFGFVKVTGCVHITIDEQKTLVDVMNKLADAIGIEHTYTSARRGDVRHLRQQLYMAGVCLMLVDELQFVTLGGEANTALTRMLYFLRGLGVPFVYTINYSAGHLLKKRKPEDIERLLLDYKVMLPDLEDEPSVIALLTEYKVALGPRLEINPSRDCKQIVWYVGGKKRFIKELVVCAYRLCRLKSQKKSAAVRIGMLELEAAYMDKGYAAYRFIVEKGREQLLRRDVVDKNYVCPFELSEEQVQHEAKRLEQLLQQEQRRLKEAQLKASLNSEEKLAISKAEADAGAEPPKPRRRRRPPVTAEGLKRSLRH